VNGATLEAFRSFAASARALTEQAGERPQQPQHPQGIAPADSEQLRAVVEQFRGFVDKATLLATEFAREYLKWFEPHAKRIRKLPPMPDLIDIAGYTRVENSYTRLAAWALGK
jgi:hypothetical protein